MASDVGATTVDVSRADEAVSAPPAPPAIIWVFPRPSEPSVPLRWDGPDERLIGRDADCTIRLDGTDISRRHASLRLEGPNGATVIVDLGSRNGVRVNGRRTTSSALKPGDVVRLGAWLGVVSNGTAGWKEIAPGLYGGSALQAALVPVRRAAASELPIIIEGETGTGKEVLTRTIHAWSGRAGPLVAVNCAALPEALAEGELFGYRRGAFTGADRASPGHFRSAEGGTLLLDEVTDLPLALQAKLLRVLEEREVQPLGESRPVPIDVRVVVAGQQSLPAAVQQGHFRADLLARLDGVTVQLPTLRSRREDVAPLFSRFLAEIGQGTAPALECALVERLCVHDWPFNVRELILLARRLMVLHGAEGTLRASHLPERIGAPSPPRPTPGALPASPERIGLAELVEALRASAGNVARAASTLGITRQRAYRLIEDQEVDLEALRRPPE